MGKCDTKIICFGIGTQQKENVTAIWSSEARLKLLHLETGLRKRGWISAIPLLQNIIIKAEADTVYRAEFMDWLQGKTTTIALRKICKPFGEYWGSLPFSNQVDALDTAIMWVRPGLLSRPEIS